MLIFLLIISQPLFPTTSPHMHGCPYLTNSSTILTVFHSYLHKYLNQPPPSSSLVSFPPNLPETLSSISSLPRPLLSIYDPLLIQPTFLGSTKWLQSRGITLIYSFSVRASRPTQTSTLAYWA